MKDITALEINQITKLANKSYNFGISKYPHMDSYNELNKAILEKARNGENSISFDFIDSKLKVDENYETIKLNNNRIYPHSGVCYALHNTYEYPDYLIARGFNVEIRKAQKRHGYVTKSYFISW